MDPNFLVVRSADQVSCPLGDEAAILSLRRGTYFGLGPVAAHVWGLIVEPRRVAEIVDAVAAEFDVSRDECAGDLARFIEELHGAGLVEIANAPAV
jgi:hypothetical protein